MNQKRDEVEHHADNKAQRHLICQQHIRVIVEHAAGQTAARLRPLPDQERHHHLAQQISIQNFHVFTRGGGGGLYCDTCTDAMQKKS